MQLGATVVAEEMEASLEVVAQTIARLDVPGNVIDVLLDSYRRESTGIRTVRAPGRPLDSPAERDYQDADRDARAAKASGLSAGRSPKSTCARIPARW